MMDPILYLDHMASTPIHPKVKQAVLESLEYIGNPSSHHPYGREIRMKIEEARESVASLIHADPDEIIFTSGATESNALAMNWFKNTQGGICITSGIEHNSILNHSDGVGTVSLSGENIATPETVKNAINSVNCFGYNNVLVSIGAVNNETGNIQPLTDVINAIHIKNAYVLCDASAAINYIPMFVDKINPDYLSSSGEKFGALSGSGFLYVNKNAPFYPLFKGSQEKKRRAGTENVIGIIAMGVAANEISYERLAYKASEYNLFVGSLQKKLDKNGIQYLINSDLSAAFTGILNISFKDIDSAALLYLLSRENIYASAGSACRSCGEENTTLTTMRVPDNYIKGTIRLSFGNEPIQIDRVVNSIVNSVLLLMET